MQFHFDWRNNGDLGSNFMWISNRSLFSNENKNGTISEKNNNCNRMPIFYQITSSTIICDRLKQPAHARFVNYKNDINIINDEKWFD